MPKKSFIILIYIFLIMLGLNFLTPLYYGDDLVYAFIWPNQFINIPLPENVVRINSIQDILVSQWRHYFTGNGRTIAHLFVQFFVWQGKWLFNVFNSLVFVILILQIHWISDAGKISLKKLRADSICWIFFILWMCNAGFYEVYLWLAGACNYLWSLVILLFFLLPFIQNYFQIEQIESCCLHLAGAQYCFFLLGVCAGWGNENTICWILLFLGFRLFQLYKSHKLEKWMLWGYLGLFSGYVFLIFAPGNAARTNYYITVFYMNDWLNVFSWEYIKGRLITFGIIEDYQLILWYFILTSLRKIQKQKQELNETIVKYINLSKKFCVLSILVNLIMIFTPDFPLRSGFASLVFIAIAASLLVRIQAVLGQDFLSVSIRKKLALLGVCIFTITLLCTYLGTYLVWQYDSELMNMVSIYKQSINNKNILEVPSYKNGSIKLNWASGRHLQNPSLTSDENDWINTAFARYYDINGIRVVN
ncbi:MAG: hypothetical protein IJT36_07550 [Alphaproteobacteria bacterium]|nr:hypothetical protein [Alphaproteobacteria bacterium]